MSLDRYNQLEKAARNTEYLAINDRGISQLEAGKGQQHEPLKHRKAWSRRIDDVNRLVYNIDSNGSLWIIACKGHYED